MNQSSDFLDARSAAALLGVRLPTLYAYASRGLVTSVASGSGRARLYAKADLERLRVRSEARAGHGAVAGGALRWGEPVLESAITAIAPDGPHYRGHAALELARSGTPFEPVCELLWHGALPARAPVFAARGEALPHSALAGLAAASFVERMHVAMPLAALEDPLRFDAASPGEIVHRLARALAPDARRERASRRAPSVAAAALASFGVAATPERLAGVQRVLVLCADHELNVSAFAARVVASTGATLAASVAAALAAFSGPIHGAASDRVEALLDEVETAGRARGVLRERLRRGEAVPGFGHPLYPAGDPRGAALLALGRGSHEPRLRVLGAVIAAMAKGEQPLPNLDVGLVAARVALGLPRGAASALFALGRSAGWIAHALEQRAAGHLLRPRARYVGPV